MAPDTSMTESEWLSSVNARSMLAFIRQLPSGRKHWLLACACCRSVWHLLTDARREIVEVVERYADGQATDAEVAAFYDTFSFVRAEDSVVGYRQADDAVQNLSLMWFFPTSTSAVATVGTVCRSAAEALAKTRSWEKARSPQSDLIRDVFGNPFRPAAFNPSWRTWSEGTVVKLAQNIYDERAFAGMPILADALEEAGCQDQNILNHCRQPGEHVRGCWVVDSILCRS